MLDIEHGGVRVDGSVYADPDVLHFEQIILLLIYFGFLVPAGMAM